MFYSSKADELREFIRDKLGFSGFDVGEGWLIFDLPEADLGCHPSDTQTPSGTHEISFYTDDIHTTVAELKEKGVEFTTDIEDAGWGLITRFKVPGDFSLMLYEPKYKKASR